MADHGNGGSMRPMYVVWIGLLGITLMEVFLAYMQVPLHWMLISLLGLSVVKAAMIMAYFMHLKFERLNLVLTLVPALVMTILLLNVIFPDAMRLGRLGVNRGVQFQDQAAGEDGHE